MFKVKKEIFNCKPAFFCGIALFILFLVSCVTTGTAAKPEWVDAPESVYPASIYISAVGESTKREWAEQNALSNLSRFFKTSISVTQDVSDRYLTLLNDSNTTNSQETEVLESILITSKQDSLIGAKIAQTWIDEEGRCYAVAVMEKQKTAQIYSELVNKHTLEINKLLEKSKNADSILTAYSDLSLAYVLAAVNDDLLSVISVVDVNLWKKIYPEYGTAQTVKKLASEEASKITVNLIYDASVDDRIVSAFADVFTGMNFKVQKNGGGDYNFTIDYKVEQIVLADNPNKFCRYTVNGTFADAKTGKILSSFSENGREGHVSYTEAYQRVLRVSEEKILDDFAVKFNKFIDTFAGI